NHTTTVTWDTLQRLTAVTTRNGAAQIISSYAYTLTPSGLKQSVTEAGGRAVTWTRDAAYHLTGETIAGDPNGKNGMIGYTLDNAGNRLSRTSTVPGIASTTNTFDANDGISGDTVDAEGSTLTSGGSSYSYDFEDHLVG